MNIPENLPEKLPCAVLLEPGLRLGKGVDTQTLLIALCRRDECDRHVATMTPKEREALFEANKKFFDDLKMQRQNDKNALFRAALRRWGPEAQLLKTAEEAAELSAAVVRNTLFHDNESDMAAEMADVEIMLEQARYNGLGPLIDHHKERKLHRLAGLLGGEYKPAPPPHEEGVI